MRSADDKAAAGVEVEDGLVVQVPGVASGSGSGKCQLEGSAGSTGCSIVPCYCLCGIPLSLLRHHRLAAVFELHPTGKQAAF